jgi:hypothetical protein
MIAAFDTRMISELLKVKKYIQIFFFLAFAFPVSAQPVLTATVNKNTVAVGEQFQITYSLNGNGRSFQGPDLKDFYVLAGPSQSSQIQIVNGSYSQSLSFTYYLQAKSEGTFKIGFASIEAEGKRIQSNGLIINVVKGSANSQGQKNAQQGENAGLSEKNIFLKAEVNKTTVYQGEALTVSFKLYTNVNIINYTISRAPSLNGFWNQDIELPEQLQLHNETVDGINYKVGVLKKVVLFPQQSGTLSIDPMELECIARIQVKGRNRMDPFGVFNDPFFNDPFFGMGSARDVKYAFRSNKVLVHVKELPAGAPASFNGSVGQLNFSATMDKTETKANEPVTLKVRINGNGNLKLVEAPQIEFPADIEAYDPKISDNLHVSESGVSGSKTIEYLLIPRHEGTYDLQPVTFSYFDLAKKQYISRTSGPFRIKVGKGVGPGTTTATSVSKSDFQLIGKDIRYIKINEPEFITTGRFYGSPAFYAWVLSPFLAVGGLMWYKRRLNLLNNNAVAVKSKKATAVAQRRLALARKLLSENRLNPYYDEISKTMWGFMGDKLAIPPADLSVSRVEDELRKRSVSDELIASFTSTLNQCEMARFAGAGPSNAEDLYNKAIASISGIEEKLRG